MFINAEKQHDVLNVQNAEQQHDVLRPAFLADVRQLLTSLQYNEETAKQGLRSCAPSNATLMPDNTSSLIS